MAQALSPLTSDSQEEPHKIVRVGSEHLQVPVAEGHRLILSEFPQAAIAPTLHMSLIILTLYCSTIAAAHITES